MKWKWKSNLRILVWFFNAASQSLLPHEKVPCANLAWGWVFNSPFSLPSWFPNITQIPRDKQSVLKMTPGGWLPCPYPQHMHTFFFLSISCSQGNKALKSQSFRGPAHMPLPHFRMLKRNKKTLTWNAVLPLLLAASSLTPDLLCFVAKILGQWASTSLWEWMWAP